MANRLKGGEFLNRWLICGKFTALSPLHIGSGEMKERPGLVDEKEGKPIMVSSVVKDVQGKPYIPGSTLRGRLWSRLNHDHKKETKKALKDKKRDEQVRYLKDKANSLDILFGSQASEGKIEVWDSMCKSSSRTKDSPHLCNWLKGQLTYVEKSVAIDPGTGTASDGRLYNFELVPAGTEFDLRIAGQNLTDEDVKTILLALQEFNNNDDPLTLGAMDGRGFGQFEFELKRLYKLDADKLEKWKKLPDDGENAGYRSIERKDFKVTDTSLFTQKNPGLFSNRAPSRRVWDMKLETPLCVRSGTSIGWKSTEVSKTRNMNMKYRWDISGEANIKQNDLHPLGDLHFGIRLEDGKAVPYYHIPSSTIRGSLREWAVKHLLPEDWWDIEGRLKNAKKEEKLPEHLKHITNFFGSALNHNEEEFEKMFNRKSRMRIEVEPFSNASDKPDVDGSWGGVNDYGPKDGKRHIKTRNPLDRVTNAAKDGALHSNLEFSRGQKMTVTVRVFEAEAEDAEQKEFDKNLLNALELDINEGMIRFGGLSGIGRGRVKIIKEEKEASHV